MAEEEKTEEGTNLPVPSPFNEIDKDAAREAIERLRAAQKERIDSIDLDEHLRKAFKYLDRKFAFFLTDVLNLGKPEWSSAVPTAAVFLPTEKSKVRDFRFIINPVFAATLEPEELAFILGHETMHILFNHLRVGPRMLKAGAEKEKTNIAMDLVINNFLRDRGLEPSDRLKENMFFGEDWCGYNTALSTVRQTYRDIDDNKLQERKEMNDALSQFLQELGVPATGGHDWIYDQEGSSGTADEMRKGAPKSVTNKVDDEDGKQRQYASAGVGSEAEAVRRWVETKGMSLDWAKLLQKVNPDFLKMRGPAPKASFHRVPRKLTYIMERERHMGSVPVMEISKRKDGEQPAIAMYIDGSGSCADYIDKFVALCRSIPEEEITLFPFSFSTYVQPLDLHKPEVAQGGTEFSIIENSILNSVVPQLGHYPKSVVVMTDGIGNFSSTRPKTQYEKNWLWLLKGRYAYQGRCGIDVDIDEFTKGMKF